MIACASTGLPEVGFPMTRFLTTAVLLALTASPFAAKADERLTGIACRSVHLSYPSEPAVAFYNEITVRESAPGTYFQAAGWHRGYFGIQEQADGKKVIIFSVWDSHATDDKNAVPLEKRTHALYHDPAVRVGRFGGEGTGGQSFMDYDWKVGQTCRFLLKCRPGAEGMTDYLGFFYMPETKTWKHLATFTVPEKDSHLKGLYSFVEDFRRNRESTGFTRRAEFGPAFVRDDKGEWKQLLTATFTGDGNKAVNIDAGTADTRFFLATGGPIENKTVKLWAKTTVPESKLPADLDSATEATPTPEAAK
jgi:hypothetical protein